MRNEILRMDHVSLKEGGVPVLDNISLYILEGEILGLLVSDHKGKEPFIQLLLHNIPIHFGSIYFNNKLVNIYEHSDYSANRICVVGQFGGLVSELSVADNLFVMRSNFKKHVINKNVLRQQTQRLFREVGIEIEPNLLVSKLNALEQCMVEIVKAKLMGCRLIILCDLCNFLSQVELEKFQQIVRLYQREGYSFLYIGNHHQELFKICDRTALLSKGQICKIFDWDEMKEEYIQPYIISYDLTAQWKLEDEAGDILRFANITTENMKNISFSVKKRECLLILDMNNTVLQDILNIMKNGKNGYEGKITYLDKRYTKSMSAKFLENGIAIISENPVSSDIFSNMGYLENLIFPLDIKLKKSNITKKYMRSVVSEFEPKVGACIHENDISRVDIINLYKLVYYRILLYHPQIVFCINPFAWGDMLSRRKVLQLMQELKDSGITIVLLSVTISDALDIADRLLIIKEGELVSEYTQEDFYAFQEQR